MQQVGHSSDQVTCSLELPDVQCTHAKPCPCRASTMPLCELLLKATAWARHGMCELTSAVSRRPVGDVTRFGFFRLPRGVSRLAFRIFPATRGHSRRTRHCRWTAGAQHVMCELARHGTARYCELARHGTAWYVRIRAIQHGKDTAWYVLISATRHGRGTAWYLRISVIRHGRDTAWYLWISATRHSRGTAWYMRISLNAVHSCSRHGVVAARLTSERPENVIHVSKTFTV